MFDYNKKRRIIEKTIKILNDYPLMGVKDFYV